MGETSYRPQKFAVIGAGPVGCTVAAFLSRAGYEVTLCDIVAKLLEPALDPGIQLEGADSVQARVTRTTTDIDDLLNDPKERDGFKTKYGYDLKPAATWQEYTDIAEWFTRPEEGVYGTARQGKRHEALWYAWRNFLYSFGGDMTGG